jgi:hypothetical protein
MSQTRRKFNRGSVRVRSGVLVSGASTTAAPPAELKLTLAHASVRSHPAAC